MWPVLIANWAHYLFGVLMFVTSVFLILVVLVQRGRGGGLAGALGGLGGQSAFGTKAGDVFTRVTVGVALVWGLVCVLAILVLNDSGRKFGDPNAPTSVSSPKTPDATPEKPGGGPDKPGQLSANGDTGDTTTTTTDKDAPATTPSEPSAGPAESGEPSAERSSDRESSSSEPARDATPQGATP